MNSATTHGRATTFKSSKMTQTPGENLNKVPRGEFLRKALHMSPGLLPFLLAAVPHPPRLDTTSLVFVTGIAVILTGVFLSCYRVVRRPAEDNFLSTTVSYPATIIAPLWLFPEHAEFAGVIVTILAFGDGSAYFGGKLFGKRSLPWNRDKTWVGTICFVCCSAPIATLAYWCETNDGSLPFWVAVLCGTTAASAGAVAESLPVKVTDNLRVGVAAALAVIAAHFAIAA